MSKNQYDVECSILKLRIYDHDFSGCELFVSIDSQKKCFYGKIQSNAKTIDFNRSRHLIASVDLSSSQQPVVNLSFLAKKPHNEFFASKDIYNLLTRATSIESNIMESMSILMKSRSHKNVAEIFFTLIINLSYFSPIRSFPVRAPDIRAKPSIFTPDTKFNPSKALTQELAKLSSPKRIKLNYQLSPKQDRKIFDTLSNQIFNEASSSDFDNGSFVASSQVEMITEPNQPNHSTQRKHQNSSFSSNAFDYSSTPERIKESNSAKEEEKSEFSQNQNQQVNSNLNLNPDSGRHQVERIKTPETKNSQSMLSDVGKHSVRKPISWIKGKKPDYMKSDKENDTFSVEFPNHRDNLRRTEENKNNNYKDDNFDKVPELNKPANKPTELLSPILDILNSKPHLSPRLPHLDLPKTPINSQQQKTDNKNDNINSNNDNNLTKNDIKKEKSEDQLGGSEFSKDEVDNKKTEMEEQKGGSEFSKDESDNKKTESEGKKEESESTKFESEDKKDESDHKSEEIDISISIDKKDEGDTKKEEITISVGSDKDEIDISIGSDKKDESDTNKKEETATSDKKDESEILIESEKDEDEKKQSSEKKEEKSSDKEDVIIDDFASDFDNTETKSEDTKDKSEDKSDETEDKKDENEEKKDENKKDNSESDDDDDDDDFF